MPLVTINSLPPANSGAIAPMLENIRDTGAAALQCSPSNVWVIFQPIQPAFYLYGDPTAASPQEKANPPIVLIKALAGRTPSQREAFVKAVSRSVGQGLSVPRENVWIHYQEMQQKDVWFEERWA